MTCPLRATEGRGTLKAAAKSNCEALRGNIGSWSRPNPSIERHARQAGHASRVIITRYELAVLNSLGVFDRARSQRRTVRRLSSRMAGIRSRFGNDGEENALVVPWFAPNKRRVQSLSENPTTEEIKEVSDCFLSHFTTATSAVSEMMVPYL